MWSMLKKPSSWKILQMNMYVQNQSSWFNKKFNIYYLYKTSQLFGSQGCRGPIESILTEKHHKLADACPLPIYWASVTSVRWCTCTEPKDIKRQYSVAGCSPCCHLTGDRHIWFRNSSGCFHTFITVNHIISYHISSPASVRLALPVLLSESDSLQGVPA